MDEIPVTKHFMSVTDAAAQLGMTADGVRKLVKSKRIAALRLGGKPTGNFMISIQSVADYGAERKRRGPLAKSKGESDGNKPGPAS